MVCVCVRRVKRPPAGRGVEVAGGCLGLRFLGGGRLLVGGACRQGLRLRGQQVGVGYYLLALVLLVRVDGPP